MSSQIFAPPKNLFYTFQQLYSQCKFKTIYQQNSESRDLYFKTEKHQHLVRILFYINSNLRLILGPAKDNYPRLSPFYTFKTNRQENRPALNVVRYYKFFLKIGAAVYIGAPQKRFRNKSHSERM